MSSFADSSDAELVALAGQGDRAAFGELVRRHQGSTQRFARRLAGDPELAADLTQEALVQAFLSLGSSRDPARFRGWLCGGLARARVRPLATGLSGQHLVEGATPSPPFLPEVTSLYTSQSPLLNSI